MGFQEIFVRFLGFIPAPVMFGSLIDKSCQLWQKDDCTDDTTSCVEYDNTYFRCVLFQVNGSMHCPHGIFAAGGALAPTQEKKKENSQ